MQVLWSHKIKYDSNKNKGRITNKIWDGKNFLLDGLLQLEPLPNIIENTEYILIQVYCMNLEKNKFV